MTFFLNGRKYFKNRAEHPVYTSIYIIMYIYLEYINRIGYTFTVYSANVDEIARNVYKKLDFFFYIK